MPVSYEICLVRLFILHIAMQPKEQGFPWFWPKSALTELNVKFAMMKNIVVECPGPTVSQSPLPRYNVFALSNLTFFKPVAQEKAEVKSNHLSPLLGSRLIREAGSAQKSPAPCYVQVKVLPSLTSDSYSLSPALSHHGSCHEAFVG